MAGTINFTVFAQTRDSIQIYKDAFAEQLQMLKGEKPLSYKRAIFLTENAFHKGKLDYKIFSQEFNIFLF